MLMDSAIITNFKLLLRCPLLNAFNLTPQKLKICPADFR
jgi:hypothetical protein